SSIAFSWSANGNRAETVYVAEISTDDFATVNVSSRTRNLAVLFGAGGEGPGLAVNTTYYLRVKSIGWTELESTFVPTASTATLADPPAAANFFAVFATSVTVSWTPVDAVGYTVDASSTNFSGSGKIYSSTTANGSAAALTVTGLFTNTTYYFRAGALNYNGVHSYAAPGSTKTVGALVPIGLARVSPDAPSALIHIVMTSANTIDTKYMILRKAGSSPTGEPENGSTYPVGSALGDATVISDAASVIYDDTHLALNTTYYYTIYSHDSYYYTAPVSTAVLLDLKPRFPYGLGRTLSADASTITVHWSPVTTNEDGTSFADPDAPLSHELFGYRVFRATSATSPGVLRSTLSASTTYFTDTIAGFNYFYYIAAYDEYGLLSATSTRIESFIGDLDVTAPDQLVTLTITKSVVSFLEAKNNPTGHPLYIEAQSHPEDASETVLASAEFGLKHADNDAPVSNVAFPTPDLQITFRFKVVGNEAVFTPQGAAPSAAFDTDDAAIYWFNGVEWTRLYGRVSPASQTISVQTANVGRYQVRAVARGDSFHFDASGVSNRFITPNGDGRNDYVVFTFDNPKDSAVIGRIYDVKGALVADMAIHPGLDQRFNRVWDGKSGGRAVPPGIYIYQFEVEGKTINGTVVVVR
ncbi:MAG: gliding motility-associated C-terminal domain-containing protein, partial [Elusimicrobiota bacterium]